MWRAQVWQGRIEGVKPWAEQFPTVPFSWLEGLRAAAAAKTGVGPRSERAYYGAMERWLRSLLLAFGASFNGAAAHPDFIRTDCSASPGIIDVVYAYLTPSRRKSMHEFFSSNRALFLECADALEKVAEQQMAAWRATGWGWQGHLAQADEPGRGVDDPHVAHARERWIEIDPENFEERSRWKKFIEEYLRSPHLGLAYAEHRGTWSSGQEWRELADRIRASLDEPRPAAAAVDGGAAGPAPEDRDREIRAHVERHRNNPKWVRYREHTDRWDEFTLVYGEDREKGAKYAEEHAAKGWRAWQDLLILLEGRDGV